MSAKRGGSLLVIGGVAILAALSMSAARTLAEGSSPMPHGGYSSSTDLCRTCHAWHDAKSEVGLLNEETEREVCYTCHDGTGASTDIRSQFGEGTIGSSTKVSFHPVPQKVDGLQLVCSDCHSSHKPLLEDTKLLAIRTGDVDEDGNPIYLYSPPDTPIGNAFCYGCHGTSSTLPPKFRDFTRFDTSPHSAITTPDDPAAIQCLACHQPHASAFPSLLTDEQVALCVTCHDGTGAGDFDPATWGTSGHATTGGLVCADCHDSHGSANAFMLRDDVGGASGYDGTPATWQQLQLFCTACHSEPSDAVHTDVDVNSTLCTDCHSHGTSPF